MKKFLLLIIIILLLFIFRGHWLSAYAGLFTVNNATKGADMMVVLSGNIESRPAYAAKLFQQGYAKRLFLTQEKKRESPMAEYVKARNFYAEMMLRKGGVDVEWLPNVKDGATSTFDEAYDLAAFLQQDTTNIQRVILVTDAFHTRRASLAFKKVLKNNGLGHIRLEMAASPNNYFDESSWYQHEKGLILYFEETLKILFYVFNTENTKLVEAY